VAIFTMEELSLLYRYATDRERVLMLLGLNLGFARAECVSLRKDELYAGETPPAIKRVRRKSRVYGEFALGRRPSRRSAGWQRTSAGRSLQDTRWCS
jgi:hypothetical protein